MQDGYKVIDMDTHVNPSMEVLEKYVDPGFRPRLAELKPYDRVQKRSRPDGTVQTSVGMTVAPIPYDRFPGEAPREEHTKSVPGGRTALDGRVITHHRKAVQPSVDNSPRWPLTLPKGTWEGAYRSAGDTVGSALRAASAGDGVLPAHDAPPGEAHGHPAPPPPGLARCPDSARQDTRRRPISGGAGLDARPTTAAGGRWSTARR